MTEGSAGASPSEDPEQERALFFGVSAARLRGRARWASVVLALSALLPYELIDGNPQFVWDLAPELPIAGLIAALALPLAGLAIAAGRFITRRASSLAVVAIVALLAAAAFRQLGMDRNAWDTMATPETLSARPAGALLALALTAAASNLSFRPSTRKASPYVVGAACACAIYFYVWPGRGEAPLVTIVRALARLGDLPSYRYQIGVLLLVTITVWPLVVTAAGATLLKRPALRDESWIAILANWSMVVWLFLLAYRALLVSQATAGLITFLGAVLVVAAVVTLTSAALAVLVESFFVSHGDEAPISRSVAIVAESRLAEDPFATDKRPIPAAVQAAGLDPKKAVVTGAAALVVLVAAQALLALPPAKGTSWELRTGSPRAEKVFGEMLPAWSEQRRIWDFRTRDDLGASARVELKASARDLVGEAKEVDPGLADALLALTRESDDLDLAGRRWSRLVADVNEASRRAGLPYYVDASVTVRRLDDGTFRRHFYTYSYEIVDVRRWDADGDAYATLRVRPLGHRRDAHARLGFSSDADPFALVVLDETERRAEELRALAPAKLCAMQASRELDRGMDDCGAKLAALVDEEDDLAGAVLAGTERHELQHQIDGPRLPLATTVISYLEGYSPTYQDAVNREVSAFLAELAAEDGSPRLTLWQLLMYLLPDREGTYAHAAILVFEAFDRGKVTYRREIDGKAFWSVYTALWELGDDGLREAAREAYDRIYGEELPAVAPAAR